MNTPFYIPVSTGQSASEIAKQARLSEIKDRLACGAYKDRPEDVRFLLDCIEEEGDVGWRFFVVLVLILIITFFAIPIWFAWPDIMREIHHRLAM